MLLGGLGIVGWFVRLGVVLCCGGVLLCVVRSRVLAQLLSCYYLFLGILKGDRALYSKSRSLERALIPRPAAYEAAALLG